MPKPSQASGAACPAVPGAVAGLSMEPGQQSGTSASLEGLRVHCCKLQSEFQSIFLSLFNSAVSFSF